MTQLPAARVRAQASATPQFAAPGDDVDRVRKLIDEQTWKEESEKEGGQAEDGQAVFEKGTAPASSGEGAGPLAEQAGGLTSNRTYANLDGLVQRYLAAPAAQRDQAHQLFPWVVSQIKLNKRNKSKQNLVFDDGNQLVKTSGSFNGSFADFIKLEFVEGDRAVERAVEGERDAGRDVEGGAEGERVVRVQKVSRSSVQCRRRVLSLRNSSSVCFGPCYSTPTTLSHSMPSFEPPRLRAPPRLGPLCAYTTFHSATFSKRNERNVSGCMLSALTVRRRRRGAWSHDCR